ncbi:MULTISPECIES: zinc-ribbon domain-containing protein [Methyloversatilis]|uniref:zinc-ribbon domain-containing protein n=1 Tax=Methyloversatilis TaxID=378210 RepID=UPI0034C5E93F
MICSHCGVENLESALRCIRCGADVVEKERLATEDALLVSVQDTDPQNRLTLGFVLVFASTWLMGALCLFLYAGLLPWLPWHWPFFVVLVPLCWFIARKELRSSLTSEGKGPK